MAARIQKKEIVNRVAKRLVTDETTAEAFLDATIEVLYEAIKAGESVTLPGLGGFYVRPEPDSWVFKFNPGQKLRALFGWSSTYTGEL
jgi:DNA-binding protein HU-beta